MYTEYRPACLNRPTTTTWVDKDLEIGTVRVWRSQLDTMKVEIRSLQLGSSLRDSSNTDIGVNKNNLDPGSGQHYTQESIVRRSPRRLGLIDFQLCCYGPVLCTMLSAVFEYVIYCSCEQVCRIQVWSACSLARLWRHCDASLRVLEIFGCSCR